MIDETMGADGSWEITPKRYVGLFCADLNIKCASHSLLGCRARFYCISSERGFNNFGLLEGKVWLKLALDQCL